MNVSVSSSRTWGLILPAEWPNVDDILGCVRSLGRHYYYILHDRDVDFDTGEQKKPHYHALITYPSPRQLRTVQKDFAVFSNLKPNSFERIRNAHGSKRYLLHLDSPEKVTYSPDEVKTNDALFKDVAIEKKSGDDEIDELMSAFNLIGESSTSTVFNAFRPFLARLNSYQRFQAIISLRRELRLESKQKFTCINPNDWLDY